MRAIQDSYPEDLSHCYGCGASNSHGHQLKTYRVGEGTVARFTPQPYHTAIPGFVYGGLIASVIDCHGTGTAAAVSRDEDDAAPYPRFVTASLHVDYLEPTPMGVELELRGAAVEIKGRKVVVEVEVRAAGRLCARGRVVAVRVPEAMMPPAQG